MAPTWFPLFFAGMLIALTHLLAAIAGHPALLARHPPVAEPLEELHRFASGSMRGVRFGNSLHVGIGKRGLHLAPSWPFRPLLWPGVPCIPWSEVRLLAPSPGGVLGWFRGTRLEIRSIGAKVELGGSAGRAVERKLGAAVGPALIRTR
jgi:hypothetical protein